MTRPTERIRIKITCRDDCFYVSTDDIQGLWLWDKDLNRLLRNVGPAIQVLYKYNKNMIVEVREPLRSKISKWFLLAWYKVSKSLLSSRFDEYRIYPVSQGPLTGTSG